MQALILIAVLMMGAGGDTMSLRQTGDLRIYYHAADAPKIDKIVAGIEQTRQDLRDKLGIDFKEPVEVVLARGRGRDLAPAVRRPSVPPSFRVLVRDAARWDWRISDGRGESLLIPSLS